MILKKVWATIAGSVLLVMLGLYGADRYLLKMRIGGVKRLKSAVDYVIKVLLTQGIVYMTRIV